MRKPQYGWFDLLTRSTAVLAAGMSAANLAAGGSSSPWSLAWVALALALIACSKVERLRQDIRISQTGRVHLGQDTQV